jgi:hypothetical protein
MAMNRSVTGLVAYRGHTKRFTAKCTPCGFEDEGHETASAAALVFEAHEATASHREAVAAATEKSRLEYEERQRRREEQS